MMPRPDVARLGVSYRRIPILTIGKDVYLDTRLQLLKLEAMFPSLPRLGAGDADGKAVERLLSHFIIDGGIFSKAVQLLPTDLPLLNDPAYYKDRGDFMGANLSKEAMQRARPEAVMEFTSAFSLLETTLLADGRNWILKTDEPSLADIEAVWPLHWLSGIPGALPEDMFSPRLYPKVYAWIQRFQKAVSTAKSKLGKPKTLSGEEAAKLITTSPFHQAEGGVDLDDPVVVALKLQKGDKVTLYPADTGRSHKDVGTLVAVNQEEVVIEVEADGDTAVRVHAPRHGFHLKKYTERNGPEVKL